MPGQKKEIKVTNEKFFECILKGVGWLCNERWGATKQRHHPHNIKMSPGGMRPVLPSCFMLANIQQFATSLLSLGSKESLMPCQMSPSSKLVASTHCSEPAEWRWQWWRSMLMCVFISPQTMQVQLTFQFEWDEEGKFGLATLWEDASYITASNSNSQLFFFRCETFNPFTWLASLSCHWFWSL